MKSGYAAIIGRPNVGKSTLLNRLVGEKLAGVSSKPQTTRHGIRGILTRPEGQIVYVDTPGLHDPKDLLGEWMVGQARKFLSEVHLAYWVVFPRSPEPDDEKVLEILRSTNIPVILLINQTDRVTKPELLPVIDAYRKMYSFPEIIPISAKTGDQIELLIRKTLELLPEGEPLFPADQISDQNERFLVREMIAEKLFHFMGEELPYVTTVVLEDFKEKSGRLVSIQATIVVERDSQKAMVIGRKGQKIKQIGQAARLDIERFLGKKVFLELWVKTHEHWKRNQDMIRRLGYEG
ncbi:MAG: GTPase Era [Candidatus Omnitrophica bacterium]|nr:GTPase Era [Candidatus Omnitrophota bacterium]